MSRSVVRAGLLPQEKKGRQKEEPIHQTLSMGGLLPSHLYVSPLPFHFLLVADSFPSLSFLGWDGRTGSVALSSPKNKAILLALGYPDVLAGKIRVDGTAGLRQFCYPAKTFAGILSFTPWETFPSPYMPVTVL